MVNITLKEFIGDGDYNKLEEFYNATRASQSWPPGTDYGVTGTIAITPIPDDADIESALDFDTAKANEVE
jgi:hypothetical protein